MHQLLATTMGVNAYFPGDTLDKKLLVVGAGGIGCELLKNLAMAGFTDIEVIDLDTIDVSNLNRQFLFRREHVGMPKAQVAAEAARAMRPEMNIVYHHDSIFNTDFGLEYFKKFTVVLNALDNLAARRHVNRLCIGGKIPLIDGGTTGFLGQVRVIKRDVSECFDCVEHPVPKTFPTCTIRNTPSEFIHCITWAKYLFNQLFGEPDPDEDVSPEEDAAQGNGQVNVVDAGNEAVDVNMEETNENKVDPENAEAGQANAEANVNNEEAGQENTEGEQANAEANVNNEEAGQENAEANGNNNVNGNAEKISTRQFAALHNYDPQHLYKKLFIRDIDYLLRMPTLWKDRRAPTPYRIDDLNSVPQSSTEPPLDIQWSLDKWISEFVSSVQVLAQRFEEQSADGRVLTWDKDDDAALRFVGACANIRAHVFHIFGKSLFEVKSMAGNIIPAIATSNAIVAGLMVIEAYKVILEEDKKFKSSFISIKPTPQAKIVNDDATVKPNPKCYVCANKREVTVRLNTFKMIQKTFINAVLKGSMGMIEPDATDLVTGRIVVSSDLQFKRSSESEDHTLSQLSVVNGSQLDCDDFNQAFNFTLFVVQNDGFGANEYEITRDSARVAPVVPAATEGQIAEQANPDTEENKASGSKEEEPQQDESKRKRSADTADLEEEEDTSANKRARVEKDEE